MANATVTLKIIKMNLELDEKEASVLKAVMNIIGGTDNSCCRYTNEIWRTLDKAGVPNINLKYRISDHPYQPTGTAIILEDGL